MIVKVMAKDQTSYYQVHQVNFHDETDTQITMSLVSNILSGPEVGKVISKRNDTTVYLMNDSGKTVDRYFF